MTMYTHKDIVGSIQLAAWELGVKESEVKTTAYSDLDFGPTVQTIIARFEDWETATVAAEEAIQQIPMTNMSTYYQSIAALRRLYDLTGYPVTGLNYWDNEDEIEISYPAIVGEHGSWTAAKRAAGIHDKDDRWGGRDHSNATSLPEVEAVSE